MSLDSDIALAAAESAAASAETAANAAQEAVDAVSAITDLKMTSIDADPESDFRVQQDARLVRNYTTGTRPSAVTVGAGWQIYDTTLSKPIWSDGTTWRDAAGSTA